VPCEVTGHPMISDAVGPLHDGGRCMTLSISCRAEMVGA